MYAWRPPRRAFQAEIALKYCGSNPLLAATIFGWGRHTVAAGLAERRTGILCLGAPAAFSGRKRWEDMHAGFVAHFAQEVMKGELPLSVSGMRRPARSLVR